jgi:hypothetical protein
MNKEINLFHLTFTFMKNKIFGLVLILFIFGSSGCSKQNSEPTRKQMTVLKSEEDGPGGGIGFSLWKPKYDCQRGFGVCKLLWITFGWYPDGPQSSPTDPSRVPWCSAELNSTKDTLIGHFYSAVDTTDGNSLVIESGEFPDIADTVYSLFNITSISLVPGTYHIDYSSGGYGILKIPVIVPDI